MTIHMKVLYQMIFIYVQKKKENYNHIFYHLLIQVMNNKEEENELMNTELMISVFYPESEEDHLYFSFFFVISFSNLLTIL